jgi:pyruvate/2-oxoglutarate dehydrogenase complex dihydrolipoamide dehydrogenase (E3) component
MVVIGSSFISMEIVGTVSSRKLASIDVIGMEEFPFENVVGKEVGKGLKAVRMRPYPHPYFPAHTNSYDFIN